MGDENDTKIAVDLAVLRERQEQLEKRVAGMETKGWGIIAVVIAYIVSGVMGMLKMGGGQ